ncbi:hypothetical protein [Embleya hyalina]|uniref:Uncharacterized protein n=1 Tax=Embleya hyalina TaxID=516124 RepID=A0A401Z433_9ACTN|nr:hypothetical protein [Embleya hyalina]GCE01596.1 hypothetical protein EHYA_09362 [Embleya hyalina]
MEPITGALAVLGAAVALAGRIAHGHFRARRLRELTLRHQVSTLPVGSRLVDLRSGVMVEIGTPQDRS